MPIYSYKCQACNFEYDLLHAFKKPPKEAKICPRCKGFVKKVFAVPAKAIFKGSGFYENDYKRKDQA